MSDAVQPVFDHAAAERARLVNAARVRLLESGTVVTVEMLAQATSRSPETTRQWLRRHRQGGHLVTVTHDGSLLVPTFQLDDSFDLDHTAGSLVKYLVGHGMEPWAVWDWFETANTWLDGDTPAQALHRGHIEAARRAANGLFQEQ